MSKKIKIVLGFLAAFWAVEAVNVFTGNSLTGMGIVPRTVFGLIGIPLAPFVHSSITHLAINTIPFVLLGSLVIARGTSLFLRLTTFVALVGGGATWLLAHSATPLGSSGLVFGYSGYLVARAGRTKRPVAVFGFFIAAVFFGANLLGVIPTFSAVSFEGHLFGFLAGVLWALTERK